MAEETEVRRELAGYTFADEEQRDQAVRELDAIHYIRQNIDPDKPGMVLEIYKQILDQQLLHTPVGAVFLQELYEYLIEVPLLEEMEIPKPPVWAEADGDVPGIGGTQPPASEHGTSDTADLAAEDMAMVLDLPEGDSRAERRARLAEERELRSLQEQVKRLQERGRRMGVAIVAMVIIIVAMFAISLTSGSTTILNYENKLIDKYEEWEQELQQREAAVRERENALQ